MNWKTETCTFDDVLPVWRENLWPGRVSRIEATSAMKWLGGVDMTLMNTMPTFWRIQMNQRTVGVLSGHFGGHFGGSGDGDRSYRTRGLWVSDEFRRQGLAKLLMQSAMAQARAEQCSVVWTFPRQSSMPFYSSIGFSLALPENEAWSGLAGQGEFGPNAYASAPASSLSKP